MVTRLFAKPRPRVAKKIAMTAIVIVGPALAAQGHKSKLHDHSFSHMFRQAKSPTV